VTVAVGQFITSSVLVISVMKLYILCWRNNFYLVHRLKYSKLPCVTKARWSAVQQGLDTLCHHSVNWLWRCSGIWFPCWSADVLGLGINYSNKYLCVHVWQWWTNNCESFCKLCCLFAFIQWTTTVQHFMSMLVNGTNCHWPISRLPWSYLGVTDGGVITNCVVIMFTVITAF
jgi:hypothetical protein